MTRGLRSAGKGGARLLVVLVGLLVSPLPAAAGVCYQLAKGPVILELDFVGVGVIQGKDVALLGSVHGWCNEGGQAPFHGTGWFTATGDLHFGGSITAARGKQGVLDCVGGRVEGDLLAATSYATGRVSFYNDDFVESLDQPLQFVLCPR